MQKISVCTVCMNRLEHLKETLPVNIRQSMKYSNVEFVLLDYNSQDNLEEWIRLEMRYFIELGVLKYYKTTSPQYFHLSHAKNMAMRLASGDILCLIDADNFAGEGYLDWVLSVFSQIGNSAIITTLKKEYIPYRDQGGKICFHKYLLQLTKGFDEEFKLYGMDDVDFVNRLEDAGGERIFVEQKEFLGYIEHSTEDRVKNQFLLGEVNDIYILVTNNLGKERVVLHLLKDKSFFIVTYEFKEELEQNIFLSFSGWTIGDDGQLDGLYQKSKVYIQLIFEDETILNLKRKGRSLISTIDNISSCWRKIEKSESAYLYFIVAYGECINRRKFIQNRGQDNSVNAGGWGQGRVYLNFDMSNPIELI